jgi:hypothetical protein
MGLSRRISCLVFVVVIVLAFAPALYAAGPWDNAAAGIAEQIAGRLARSAAITLEVKNRSTLDASEFAESARALRAQLAARHVRVIVTKRPVPKVVLTLSENAQGLLWIAEIHRGEAQDVLMIQVAKPQQENPSASSEALVIRKTLIIEQREPIFDLVQFTAAGAAEPSLLVLDTEKVALYGKQDTGWAVQQSLPLKRSNPWPRDPRGRLVMREGGAFDAFTPGTECQGTTAPALTMDCADSEAGWPVDLPKPSGTVAHYVSDRNYFDGRIKVAGEETRVPEFFTSANIAAGPARLTIYTNLDGRARMFGKGPQAAAQFDGWGSDITAVQSGCGEGFQVLSTRAGDLTQPDSIQAFSVRGRDAIQASAPAEFRGPVTALWPAPDGATALAVAHDLTTGMFDAFSISISCGR